MTLDAGPMLEKKICLYRRRRLADAYLPHGPSANRGQARRIFNGNQHFQLVETRRRSRMVSRISCEV